jgi:hypothetical protein
MNETYVEDNKEMEILFNDFFYFYTLKKSSRIYTH